MDEKILVLLVYVYVYVLSLSTIEFLPHYLSVKHLNEDAICPQLQGQGDYKYIAR